VYSIAKGKPQNKGEKLKKEGFEAEEVRVSSNLFRPRQNLACESQAFLVETLQNVQSGSVPLPFSIVSELTGQAAIPDRKYIQIDFHIDFSCQSFPQTNVVVGYSPIKTVISLRKALYKVNNTSVLFLTYDEFMKIVKEGRVLLALAQQWIGKRVHVSQLKSPPDLIVREESASGTKGATLVILRMTFEKSEYHETLVPVVHVREFYEDTKTQQYKPGLRGLTFGLRAFHCVVYPVTAAMHNLQDSLIKIKTSADALKAKATQIVERLEDLEQWEEDKAETEDDDLAKVEREQRETEKRMVQQFTEGEEDDDEDEDDTNSDTEGSEKEIDLLVE
jgi:hypothetical protein